MATKQVNIDIIAKDKTRQAMRSATLGVNKLKDSVFNLRNALVGLGAGLVVKSFVDTGREVERLRVRFKFLFDEASEGEKAFKGLIKFASQVPFSLEEIQRGSANLAVVSKDAEELNRLLRITGDIASASGLDFQTTAEQIQRTFSGGINSADLFRERGVKALLGFQAGVQISAEESRNHILKAFDEGTLSVVGASETMAKTFDGTLSMIGDKFNLFKMAVMDSAPFDFLKSGAMLIEQELSKNFGSIEKAGEQLGVAIVDALKSALMFGARALDFFDPFFKFIKKSVGNLIEFAQGIPAPFDTIGILGFIMLGGKGKALILLIGGVIDNIRSGLGSIISGIADVQSAINKFTLGRSQESIKALDLQIQELRQTAEKLKTPLADVDEKFGDINEKNVFEKLVEGSNVLLESTTKNSDALEEFFKRQEKIIQKNKQVVQSGKNGMSGLTGSEMGIKGQDILGTGMSGSELFGGSSPQIVALQDMADIEVAIAQQTADKKLSILQSFNKGFMDSLDSQKSAFTQIEDIGRQSFGKLKTTLTDFVMTGKLNFADLGKFVIRSFVEMLVGEAVKMAFGKSMAMFKADAIKKAMISLYEGAMKTFSQIPFPLNILAVAGALAFGNSLINKIKGFEKGGRPPVGQPSIVGEKGAELFVPDQAGTIVPNDKLGMGKQVTVNFNINTVDARGFNELLVNSRGTIVNMINSAMNEKGRMAIV